VETFSNVRNKTDKNPFFFGVCDEKEVSCENIIKKISKTANSLIINNSIIPSKLKNKPRIMNNIKITKNERNFFLVDVSCKNEFNINTLKISGINLKNDNMLIKFKKFI
jgi:hypothetical protein